MGCGCVVVRGLRRVLVLMEVRRLGELEWLLDHRGDAHIVFARGSRRRGIDMVLLRGGWDEREDAGFTVGAGVGAGLFGDDILIGHLVMQMGATCAATRLPRTFAAEDETAADGKGEFA